MDESKIRPGRWWYGLAALIGASGVVLFGFFLVTRMIGVGSGFTQVLVPGRASLTLDLPGSYTIYHERETVMDGKLYSGSGPLTGLQCRLVRQSTGEPVALSGVRVSSSYSFGGRHGYAVFDFEVAEPGVYELTASYPGGRGGPEAVFAVGRGVMHGMLTTLLGSFAILGVAMVLSAVIAVITYLKRSNAARALAKAGQP